MDDAGVFDDAAVVGTVGDMVHVVGILISSKLPGVVEESPGASLTSPDLGKARRGDVAGPPGDGPMVVCAVLLDILLEVEELLKSRIRRPHRADLSPGSQN